MASENWPVPKKIRFPRKRSLSCGIVVFSSEREILLCHVTGQRPWDLPKGCLQFGESPCQAALRETAEECSLTFESDALVDLGRFEYTANKDLHLFATLTSRVVAQHLRCDSTFIEAGTGRRLPEMDAFGWFTFDRVGELCTPRMASVLERGIGLDRCFDDLAAPALHRLAA